MGAKVTAVAVLAAAVVVPAAVLAPAAHAAPCDAPVVNKVACENTKAGNANWSLNSLDDSIVGYTTDISSTPGGQVHFKVKTDASSYRLDIFRLGYYGGAGARLVKQLNRTTPQNQPVNCLTDSATALVDCGNWAVSLTWDVPADTVSGLYYAVLHRNDTGGENEIAFVIRDDSSQSKIFFQTSDATWHAYNRYGGNSLYYGTGPGDAGSAYAVSYNRPVANTGDENFIFNAEVPMLTWLEKNGYDVSYTTNADTARRGNLILNHKVFMAVGHDEYWSREQRTAVENARAAGVHLAFMTGNEVFWKHRWAPSLGSSPVDHRTVVTYKETKANAKIDPSPEWTGTWRDPRFTSSPNGANPENALLGQIFTVNGRRDDSLAVPAAYGKMRLWRHTPLASMTTGSYSFKPGTLGYEWDSVEDNGFQPAGVAQLSRTTVTMDGQYVLQNHGDRYASGTKTHALTLYKHASGALVFGAGTVQWAWGLDDEHAFRTDEPTSDVRIKQATVNLLADMGVQPTTIESGLTAASASTDTAPPSVAFGTTNSPTVGTGYSFNGTVIDSSGRVAGVEVSVDNGSTWHPANWTAGTASWSYTHTFSSAGAVTLKVRAVDDSANLSAEVNRAVTVLARDCPCTIWTENATPAVPSTNDGGAIELGVKFQSSVNGYVRGVRFYKGTGNTGVHTGSLWSATGTRLATGTFTAETATGWQTLTFPTAVQISAGTTYVASYFAPNGHYAGDADYFTSSAVGLEPLSAPKGVSGNPNGVFRGGSSGFPTDSYRNANYWVDPIFALDPGPDTRAPGTLSTDPLNNQGSVSLTPAVSITFDEPVTPSSAQILVNGPNGGVSGTISVAANGMKATFTPNNPLAPGTTYDVSGRATDLSGNTPSPTLWSFTTGNPRGATCPCTVWDDFAAPAVNAVSDTAAVEVGTKVRFDGRGQVLGVRFYKGFGNSGTHTGSLWSSSGQRLATGTFSGESTSGWQTLTFTQPVEVQANTTYVVSYYAPNGRYSATGGSFNSSHDYNSLHALKSGADGPNGVYRYGAGGGFPTSTYNSTNYWVDVIWRNGANGDSTPPTVTGRTPAPGATGVALNTTVSATFSEPVDVSSAQLSLKDPGAAGTSGAFSISGDGRTVTWTPDAPLAPGTQYAAEMRISDVNGNAMTGPATWSFTTTSTATCPCSLFSAAALPAVTSSNDTNAYELGVRFTAAVNGHVSGVKFYKGAGNTGTHTGSLWASNGTRLATGTFVNETATGWQTLVFDTPVPITAGQTYVASYTTTTGRYSADAGYFNRSAVSSPPLAAAASPNGVFRGGSGFPGDTFGGANYWVDVVFTPGS
ncbi:hypothetical protein BBK82_46470 [Lentzea guizhouensis]|uniref:Ig-like domain-containing protein n=1 Tax=Lentzea guizhouensis TaxID=1586287 RepID=A0A1B2HX45_9PSEU|nr:hypothetical protein BBK82_46470 [Lentzea guizhouensis]